MASHLTVTTTSPAGSSNRALNGQSGAEPGLDGVPSAFAALLGATSQQRGGAAAAKADLSLAGLAKLAFGAGLGQQADNDAEDPEAIAAVIEATLPIQTEIDAAADLADLADSLAELKASLDAGEPLDPEALKRIADTLAALADALGLDLTALPSNDDLVAMAAADLPEDASLTNQLGKAFAPVASALQTATSPELSADAELSSLIKSISDKLGSLLQSLNNGDLDSAKLAALGLNASADTTANKTELQASIAKLLHPRPEVEADAANPDLAKPSLKLPEAVIAPTKQAGDIAAPDVRPSDREAAPEPTIKRVAGDEATAHADTDTAGFRPGRDGPSDKAGDANPALVNAKASDTVRDAHAGIQGIQQSGRTDIVAAPRVIQAGYQTSQQQLNLPQLAFELVRQVNDGNTRFQMRLDPPELGRIDVKLDIDAAGQINARLTVEKAETLDLMQRDQRALEKALQQAGLDGTKTNLEFSLKQNPFGGGQQQGRDGQDRQFAEPGLAAESAEDAPPTVTLYRTSLTASGVNIIA